MKKFSIYIILCAAIFQSQAKQRNVILIIADDLGKDYCDIYPDHAPLTVSLTNIKRLLPQGVVFNNAWSNPLCSPTRAGILTGRYSFRTGVGDVVDGTNPKLSADENTIPKVLNQFLPNGISKACIGKWHVTTNAPLGNGYPNTMGFDHYEGCLAGAVGQPNQTKMGYYNWAKVTNGVGSISTNYATTENIDNAIYYITTQTTSNPSKPFYLHLAFNAPHTPYHLPPPNLLTNNTLSGTTEDIAKNPKNYFLAMAEAMDKEIGRLFDYLQTTGKWDSTDIIFMGDNGDDALSAQSTPSKGSLYQAGITVPFIISGPDVIHPNRTSNALVNTVDLFPTILELFGDTNWQNQIPTTVVDGKSLLPILLDKSTITRTLAFTEVFKAVPLPTDGKTIRNLDFKLIKFDNGTAKFFNLTDDPTEKSDLFSRALSSNETTNYNTLCSEMAALVGPTISCASLGTSVFPKLKNGDHSQSKTNNTNLSGDNISEAYLLDGKRIFEGKAAASDVQRVSKPIYSK